MPKYIYGLGVLVAVMAVIAWSAVQFSTLVEPSERVTLATQTSQSPQTTLPPSPLPSPLPSPSPPPRQPKVIIDVPFTPQAPLGQWDNPVYQDGCEEASSLMAMAWIQQAMIGNPVSVTNELQKMSDFERDTYGEYRDRSAADTAQFIRDYFNYTNITVREGISPTDIITELAAGNILIVPLNGRLLGNPHFTPPGPERHMLVINGYDQTTDEFITNDPGTRFGKNYRYATDTLYAAIRDYPTGYHEPITTINKVAIIVRPPATPATIE